MVPACVYAASDFALNLAFRAALRAASNRLSSVILVPLVAGFSADYLAIPVYTDPDNYGS